MIIRVLALMFVLFFANLNFVGLAQDIQKPTITFEKTEISIEDAQNLMVEEINVFGLERTRPFVVRREVLLEIGRQFDENLFKESLQNIKNLWIFRSVSGKLFRTENDKVVVAIYLEEKWTTLPYFLFGSAGETSFMEFGFFDVNLLGRYLELGLSYERRGPANSYKGWYRNRRFLNRQLSFRLLAIDKASLISFYNDGDHLENEISSDQKKVEVLFEKDFFPWLSLGVGGEVSTFRFDNSLNTSAGERANAEHFFEPPEPSRAYIGRLKVRIGRLDWDDYQINGTTLENTLDIAQPTLTANSKFVRIVSSLIHYRSLPLDSSLAVRLAHGFTSSHDLAQRFFIGGLQQVRGFRENQFHGTSYLFGNAEVRVPSYKSKNLVVQHVAFVDSTKVGFSGQQLLQSPYYSSSGLGIRLVIPPVFLLAIRADYAWTFGPIRRQGFSLGMVQYF